MYSGTSHCGHLSNMDTWFCPNCGNSVQILYKTTPELRTLLQSGQLQQWRPQYRGSIEKLIVTNNSRITVDSYIIVVVIMLSFLFCFYSLL